MLYTMKQTKNWALKKFMCLCIVRYSILVFFSFFLFQIFLVAVFVFLFSLTPNLEKKSFKCRRSFTLSFLVKTLCLNRNTWYERHIYTYTYTTLQYMYNEICSFHFYDTKHEIENIRNSNDNIHVY